MSKLLGKLYILITFLMENLEGGPRRRPSWKDDFNMYLAS